MKKAFRQVQFLANIATIVIAILLSFVVIKPYLFTDGTAENVSAKRPNPASPASSVQPPQPQINPVGQTVSLQNVDWAKSKKTLVLYVSATCRFCTESAPFYQRLLQEVKSKDVKFVAVLPQPAEQGNDYLKKLDVKIDSVLQGSLQTIGVRSTPTLLLVNEAGTVTESWRGKLTPEKENEVMNKVSS
jgi:peroxiredoxin